MADFLHHTKTQSAHNCRDLNVPEWLVKARAKRKEGT